MTAGLFFVVNHEVNSMIHIYILIYQYINKGI